MDRTLIISSIAVAIVVIAASAGHADSSEHLLASWSFDEGTGEAVADASGNGHKGQMRAGEAGARPTRVDGMVGQAMQFRAAAGTDILVKRHPRLNPTSGLTITAWIKHEGPIGTAAEILGKKGLARYIVDGYRLCVSRTGSLCLEIGDGSAICRVQTTRGTIRPDTWYFVAGTFAPGRGRIYINGRLIVDQEIPANEIAPSNNNLVIGNFAGRRNAMPFNGLIDEVNLLDAALGADEIFKLARPSRLQQLDKAAAVVMETSRDANTVSDAGNGVAGTDIRELLGTGNPKGQADCVAR